MRIPVFLNRDDYLQNPIMRRFLKEHDLDFVENRADYINAIEEFANQNSQNESETIEWLLKVVKEGSKDFCYRKIHGISDWHKNPALLDAKIREKFPNCPMQNILNYRSTGDMEMIEYYIITNDLNEAVKIEFTFSGLFLYGENGEFGDTTVFPIFVEVYLNEGFVVSRAKAKSTLYLYTPNNTFLITSNKIDTMDMAIRIVDEVIDLFEFETDRNPKVIKNDNSKMLYNLYNKFSYTPEDVVEKVDEQNDVINGFVDEIFTRLNLSVRNREKAILDAKIFVEKFISINGNNEDLFKNGRDAYLIKVSADDEIDLTRIDTTSDKTVPLPCTEAFFDSKKSVLKSGTCKKLHLIFKRVNDTYLKSNPLVVQMGTHKNYGYVKTMQYAEEADIKNVLQAIFENY